MIELLKKAWYFPIASYFKFFAALRLKRWNPRVIVVTGSNGKTTLLHMLESQFGAKAKVSHHANSAFGVPFDILDLHRKTLQKGEWLHLFLDAPKNVFKPLPKEKIYVVEADADRPYEGRFLAQLLKPEVVLWVSTGRTHSMNFDYLVANGSFKTVEEAIAYEYGFFLQHCKKLAVVDGDSELEMSQVDRAKASIQKVQREEYLQKYSVLEKGTTFTLKNGTYNFKGLMPEEIYLSIIMCEVAVEHMGESFDPSFRNFKLPPGRGTVLEGHKKLTIIDSTYNGNLGSIAAILKMLDQIPSKKKWVVLGDMKELGKEEKEEHEKLATILNKMDLDQIILVGKLVKKYTLPKIKKNAHAVGFDKAPDVAPFLEKYLKGGELVLFKGSQSIYLEGLIEPLLKDKEDAKKLPRQDQFWKDQRKKLGFH